MENTDFFQLVYQVVREIPYGRATSYGAIAAYLGAKRSSRMVGWAMNNAHHQQPPVPAHRVVNRNGMLTGKNHFETPFLMQQLLEKEGVVVNNDQIQDFETVFWNPMKELAL
ncbi:MAG: MGMT family protein [Flavobacteriales bacterium]|jgi:methylated-DNA-protein-cysteine methyltransferase-like protein|nr:MAG: MGMT family protein [Flavobacteriales bacterium]HRN42348.1 MGMT family protein [Vicingus sp.]MBE7442384.1 MGMT family protein [Flavobacteriales bacterium]MBV6485459.1 DNA base-flipping protein [Flavobacteriales bacterium]MBX2959063.1 MGMT family protein [Flavobacteriales bacterium]